jgi:outer membrane lipoprotein-sorting protein
MYRLHLRLLLALLLVVVTVPLTSCLFRTRKVERQVSTAPLKSSTQQDLIDFVNQQASRIQSLQATVDIDASVGDEKNGRITDYKEIRGYILARKPAMLRMIGQMPIVRNTAFDMVSDGRDFKLWIPPKNKFVVGTNSVEAFQPQQRMENIRPQHIYDALLLREITPDEIAVLENGTEMVIDDKKHRVEQPNYRLEVIVKGSNGWYLSRKMEFSRTDLLPHRQQVYDQQGNVVSAANYQDYKDYGGIQFPTTIEIEMPREDYDITLKMVKLEINRPLKDEQFALAQPPGAEVVHLDQPKASSIKGGSGPTLTRK